MAKNSELKSEEYISQNSDYQKENNKFSCDQCRFHPNCGYEFRENGYCLEKINDDKKMIRIIRKALEKTGVL